MSAVVAKAALRALRSLSHGRQGTMSRYPIPFFCSLSNTMVHEAGAFGVQVFLPVFLIGESFLSWKFGEY